MHDISKDYSVMKLEKNNHLNLFLLTWQFIDDYSIKKKDIYDIWVAWQWFLFLCVWMY